MITNQQIISRLYNLEAWADKLANECRKTRVLLQQEEVSTSSAIEQEDVLTQAQIDKIIKKRRSKLKIA